MSTCFICSKEVKDYEESELFGYDGDRIHKKCKPNLEIAYDRINNMTDNEFKDYITGKTLLL